MRSNFGSLVKGIMLAAGLSLTMSSVASAQQSGWWGQNRNDRRDDRREDRRERREDRREDRQERREERREARRGRDWDGYGNYGGSSQLRQTALNAGYNNGIEEGRKDRQRGERFEYRDESDYQRATEDYNSRLGDRNAYMQYFRQGFANGYRTGYNGY